MGFFVHLACIVELLDELVDRQFFIERLVRLSELLQTLSNCLAAVLQALDEAQDRLYGRLRGDLTLQGFFIKASVEFPRKDFGKELHKFWRQLQDDGLVPIDVLRTSRQYRLDGLFEESVFLVDPILYLSEEQDLALEFPNVELLTSGIGLSSRQKVILVLENLYEQSQGCQVGLSAATRDGDVVDERAQYVMVLLPNLDERSDLRSCLLDLPLFIFVDVLQDMHIDFQGSVSGRDQLNASLAPGLLMVIFESLHD